MMLWFTHNADALGILPTFLSDEDPRPAVEQLNANYAHGGGWHDFKGFTYHDGKEDGDCRARLEYPDDPPMREVGRTLLRDELIIVFEYSWVAVVQRDGSYRVARMD
jgi:hypothetical protein